MIAKSSRTLLFSFLTYCIETAQTMAQNLPFFSFFGQSLQSLC